jgi:glucosamine--fructose-6-phosphate aminotransferase (isomerizing)
MIVILSLIEIWFTQNLKTNFINNIYYPFIENKLNNLRNLSSTINNMLYSFSFLNSIKLLKDFIIESKINNIFILSKNILYPIASEACLKIKETCYIHAESFSAGSLKHGPFALLDKDNLTILLIDYTDLNSFEKIKSTYYEILSRETNIFVFTNSKIVLEILNLKKNKYILLEKLDYYNEIIFIIALQYLCYEISIAKGINPDKPKNLAKTVTVE